MKNRLGTKLYYSISEVAEITDLQPYTLRAWEKEFSCLRPRRARGKNRAYREKDIGVILLIKGLLYEERYTTQGVKQKLKSEPELLRRAADHMAALEQRNSPKEEAEGRDTLLQQIPNGQKVPSEKGIDEGEKTHFKELIEGTKKELKEILQFL